MDVNYILAREQVERAFGRASIHAGARAAHNAMADRYRAMLDQHRHAAHSHPDASTLRATGRPFAA